jgi:DnaJ-domain-containing protein 1
LRKSLKKAQTLFFHLLYSFLGIYLILHSGFINPLYNQKLIVGVALLVPQLKFIVQFTQDSIQNIKMMTANTYYFFITLYYKIIRFIHWVQNIPQEINDFFSSFGSSKQDTQQEESYEQSQNKYHQKFYEEPKQEQQKNEYKHQEQSYTQQEETQNNSQNKTHYKTDEFAQFYSESVYVVLGVSADDDFKTIKKAYRNLVRKYHPDLNPDELEKYTEITQLINNAYEKIQGWRK